MFSIAGSACWDWALATICFKSSRPTKVAAQSPCARESRALFTSNEGFSVVAPTKVNSPLSTCGKKASCWLLLKRCTSSTNTMVRCCRRPVARGLGLLDRVADVFHPPSTALMLMNCASNASAIRRAMVVLPTPGGPQQDAAVWAARLERQAQRHARAQDMLLAHHLAQCARAQDFGQRLVQAQGGSARSVGFRVIKWSAHGPEQLLHHRPFALKQKTGGQRFICLAQAAD